MHFPVLMLAVFLQFCKVYGQGNSGSTEQGTSSYSIYNGQMQYVPEQSRTSWLSNIVRSMDFLNLFNTRQQGSAGPYQQRPSQSPYLEEGASHLAQQAMTPQSPYYNVPEVPSNIKGPNANANYGFHGAYRGQGANVPDIGNNFQLPTSNVQKPKDLSFYSGNYRSDYPGPDELSERNYSYSPAEAQEIQPTSVETPYGKKQKKQCNKEITTSDANGEYEDYTKKPCRKKTTTTTTESSKDEHEEEKDGDEDEKKEDEEDDTKNPCPPIGLWFWNGEVCIASGPVPTWACRPRDLVSTGRVATCRNKIIVGPPRGRRPSASHQHSS